ncbi:hypothetical protein LCGC14_1703300 [marine sediment metagenome]|uniref:Uncharacterized protein n=1 Tax=marine sediment metagenome TaxID=412755 RepID=A0A0F9HHU9_9ZZZZ
MKFTISVSEEIVKKMDNAIESIGHGANRSGYISDILKEYFERKTK